MNYNNMKFLMKTQKLYVPASGTGEKNISLVFIGENTSFIDTYDHMKIRRQDVPFVFVPTFKKPHLIFLTPEYRSEIRTRTLRPIKGYPEDVDAISDRNYFYDADFFLNSVINRYNITNFSGGMALRLFEMVFANVTKIDSTKQEKVLLYSVNIDNELPPKLKNRKIFPVLYKLLNPKGLPIPFDKIILFTYSKRTGEKTFRFVWDKEVGNLSRLRSVLLSMGTNKPPTTEVATTESVKINNIDCRKLEVLKENYESSENMIDSLKINDEKFWE